MVDINPFPTTGYVAEELFCDREQELSRLKSCLQGGNHHTIISLRRMGKTSLVDHFISKYSKSRGVAFLKIDVQGTANLAEFNQVLATAVSNSFLSPTGKVTSALTSFLSRFRATLAVDPITQLPSVELGVSSSISQTKTLTELLNELETAPKRVILAIDELQQIVHYPGGNAEAILRSALQPLRNVSCIFAGSRKDMMTSIFSDHRRPFYHSTDMMYLEPIERATYAAFIKQRFAASGKKIDIEMAALIYTAMRGHTYYVQLICRRIWASGGKRINLEQQVHNALIDACKESEQEFYTYRNLLPASQWALLLAIAREGVVEKPSGKDFIMKHKLGLPGTVSKSLKVLVEKELVYQEMDGSFLAYNPLFSWWARYLT